MFADEPTGNLDSESSAEVLDHLRRSVRELGQTVVMVTHELAAAAYADDVLVIADGEIRAHLTDPTSDQLVATLRGDTVRTVLLASLRTHTRRYVAATIAVVIGVAFVVVTNTLASATRNGLLSERRPAVPRRRRRRLRRDRRGRRPPGRLRRGARRPRRSTRLDEPAGPRGRPARRRASDVGALTPDATLRWLDLRAGRFPSGPDEAVADVNAAKGEPDRARRPASRRHGNPCRHGHRRRPGGHPVRHGGRAGSTSPGRPSSAGPRASTS